MRRAKQTRSCWIFPFGVPRRRIQAEEPIPNQSGAIQNIFMIQAGGSGPAMPPNKNTKTVSTVSTLSRPQVDPESTPSQPRADPKSTPERSGHAPSSPRTRPAAPPRSSPSASRAARRRASPTPRPVRVGHPCRTAHGCISSGKFRWAWIRRPGGRELEVRRRGISDSHIQPDVRGQKRGMAKVWPESATQSSDEHGFRRNHLTRPDRPLDPMLAP